MLFSGTAQAGAEEWLCPQCARRILLRWPPDYQRLVLESGDTTAVHTASKGGARVGEIAVAGAPAEDDRNWLWSHGIDWDGTAG